MAIKIYNPRWFLRNGISQPLNETANGDTVLVRVGSLKHEGKPTVRSVATGTCGIPFYPVREKIFKLVECTDEEIARYEAEIGA